VIRLEEGTTRQVRVIGSLQGPALKLLSEAVSRGPLVLDLSEVDQADESGVRLLASLPPERCTLAGCPTWLSLWLERIRQATPERAGRA
jgi:anti-anti-sigma regulatory factor